MATDRFRKLEEDANTHVQSGVSLLKTAVGISPVAAGIWYGTRKLKANEAVNTPLSRATPQQALGKAQGLAARKAQAARHRRAAQVADRIRRGLGDSDALREIVGKVQEHNALLHTLSITLEDPSNGLDTAAVSSLKSQITGLLGNSTPESVEEFAEKVTRSLLESGTDETLLRFESSMDEFRNISGQLEAPDIQIPKGGTAYNTIDMGNLASRREKGGLKGWEKRALKLQGILGGNYQMSVNAFEEGGMQFRQAQVYDRGRWVASVPLHKHSFFRSGGDFNTLYSTPKFAMNVGGAARFARQQGLDPSKVSGRQLFAAGHFQRYSDYLINHISGSMQNGRVDWRAFRGEVGMATQHVTRAAMGNDVFAAHIRRQTAIASNAVYGHSVGNMTGEQAAGFVSRFASGRGFDGGAVGAKRLLTGFGDDRRSMIGLHSGSGFAQLQNYYGKFAVDRHQLPITYRESQVTGRTSMARDFVKKVGSTFVGGVGTVESEVGARAAAYGTQGWGKHASGGLNKMMVVDFSKTGFLSETYRDAGMGITGVSHRISKPVEFSVLNPAAHGHAASKTLKQILAGKGSFTGDELSANLYVGETGSGSKYLGRDPATVRMDIELDRAGISYDKEMIYFRGEQIRKMDFFKMFSASFKGNMENVGQAGINQIYDRDARLGMLMEGLERDNIHAMKYRAGYISSDMFGKGSFSFTHQIFGSARMLGVSPETLRSRADAIHKAGGLLGNKGHQVYAQAAFELMNKQGVNARNIGMTLAGVWHGAEGGGVAKGGIDQGALERMVRGGLSASAADEALAAMRRGVSSFVDTAQVGPSTGDWGKARVGLERRFAQTAYERMRQLNMSGTDAANAVADIYTRKIGFGRHYALAEQMMAMGRSVTGQRNIGDAFTERGARRIKFGDIPGALQEAKSGKFTDFLRMQKQGAVIDFAGAPAHIGRAVSDVFGTSSVYLPGAAAYESAAGTSVRVAGGQSKEVSAAYGQLVSGFYKRLQDHAATGGDPLRKSLTAWRKNALELMGSSVSSLGSGKLSGSSSPRVSSYNLTTGGDLSDAQWKAARGLFLKTGASSAHVDSKMMLSELHGQAAGSTSRSELATSAEKFFLGMEHEDVGKRLGSGLTRVSGRHPFISAGNVFMTQIYRDVREVGALGGTDTVMSAFRNAQLVVNQGGTSATMSGREVMDLLFGQDVRTFQQIAQYSKKHGGAESRMFFETMIDNISQFSGGQGGGKIIVPRAFVDGVDIGLAPQAFMDMDGDTGLSMMASSKVRRQIRDGLKAQAANPAAMGAELQSRAIKGKFGSAIKAGMLSYGESLGKIKPGDKEIHDMMKEIGVNQSTGALDVRLRGLHEAFGNYGGDINDTRAYRDLLGALEENVLLKAKKLEVFVPLADELGSAVEGLMSNPSETNAAALGDVLRNKIFHDQGVEFGVGALTGDDAIGKWAAQQTASGSLSVNINDFQQAALNVAKQADAGATNMPGTGKAIASAAGRDPSSFFAQALAGANMETAAQRAFSDSPQHQIGAVSQGMSQIQSAFSKIDKRMAVPLALGAAGSMMAMGLVGTPGYAATPMSGPGEYVPPEVSDAIANGSLFENRPAGVDPASLGGRPAGDYGMLDRPINSGSAYMTRPSSYQVRATLPNMYGMPSALSYIQGMTGGGASGSVRINDTRRPITRSYVDRLSGEY